MATARPEDWRLILPKATAMGGLAADVLTRRLRPSARRPGALCLFGFGVSGCSQVRRRHAVVGSSVWAGYTVVAAMPQ